MCRPLPFSPFNGFGIYPDIKDQPVLADGQVRYRGEAVVALVGEHATVLSIRDEEVPIAWTPEAPHRQEPVRRNAWRRTHPC